MSRFALLSLALLAWARPAWAAWPVDGRAVCTAANNQIAQVVLADGAGGAILVWQDFRNGNYDLYAHHVLADGELDPAWTATGVPLCLASANQSKSRIITDGAGGALVVWEDLRGGGAHHVYAQRLLASGSVDPSWPDSGLAVCADNSGQRDPVLVADGAGGAIAAWVDGRGVYAQRVLASGAIDPAWPAAGRALTAFQSSQTLAQVTSDGVGGAIVTWHDAHVGAVYAVYAMRVLASGALDGAWPPSGRKVSGANPSYVPTITSDGAGGALVAWQNTPVAGNSDINAQHVLGSGSLDPAWPAAGVVLCAAANVQISPVIAPDLSGGAFVAWQDRRTGTYDVYAHHVLAAGSADPAWPADGLALCTQAGDQRTPTVVPDGGGGMIAAWDDARPVTNFDVYAQHVNVSGTLDPGWPADGLALCTAKGNQTGPTLANVSPGYAIVGWADLRGTNSDTYAMITSAPTPVAVSPSAAAGRLSLAAPFPQPARDTARFFFQLATGGSARLAVYTPQGRRVREWTLGHLSAGGHDLTWDLRDERGAAVPPGMYWAQLSEDGKTSVRRLAVLR